MNEKTMLRSFAIWALRPKLISKFQFVLDDQLQKEFCDKVFCFFVIIGCHYFFMAIVLRVGTTILRLLYKIVFPLWRG